MGLASSQARLLHLTGRMHQIEYKAQRLEAQKLQLANDSDRVYNEYLEALDATKVQYRALNGDGSVTFLDATLQMLENGNLPKDIWSGGGCSTTYLLKNGSTGELLLTPEMATNLGLTWDTDGTTSGVATHPGTLEDWLDNYPETIREIDETEPVTVDDKTKIQSASLIKNNLKTLYSDGTPTPAEWHSSEETSPYTLKTVGIETIQQSDNSSEDPGILQQSYPVEGTSEVLPNINLYNEPKITEPSFGHLVSKPGCGSTDSISRSGGSDGWNGLQDENGYWYDTYTSLPSTNDVTNLFLDYLVNKKNYSVSDAQNFVNFMYNSIDLASYKNDSSNSGYKKFIAGDVSLENITKEQIWRRLGCLFMTMYGVNQNVRTTTYNDAYNGHRDGNIEDFVNTMKIYVNGNYTTSANTLIESYTYRNANSEETGDCEDWFQFEDGSGGLGTIALANENDIKYYIASKLKDYKGLSDLEGSLEKVNSSLNSTDKINAIAIALEEAPYEINTILDNIYSNTNLQGYFDNYNNNIKSTYTVSNDSIQKMSYTPGTERTYGTTDGYQDIFNKFCYDVWNTNDTSKAKNTETIKAEVVAWLNAGGFNAGTGAALCSDFIYKYTDILNAYRSGNTLSSVFNATSPSWNNSDYSMNTSHINEFKVTEGETTGKNEITCDTKNNIASKLAWDCYELDNSIDPTVLRDKLLNSAALSSDYNWAALNYAYNEGYISNTIKGDLASNYTNNNVGQYLSGILGKLQDEHPEISNPSDFTISMSGGSGSSGITISGHDEIPGNPKTGEMEIPDINVMAKNFVYAYVYTHEGTSEADQNDLETLFKNNYSSLSSQAMAYLNDAICKSYDNKDSTTLDAIKNKTYTVATLKDQNGVEIKPNEYTLNLTHNMPSEPRYKQKTENVPTGKKILDKSDPTYQKAVQEYNNALARYNAQNTITLNGEKVKVINDGNESKYEFIRNFLSLNDAYLIEYDINTGERRDTNVSVETTLREVPDEKELKKAEAKYESDMRQIDKKDRKYDTDLAALETERSATKEEIETLKTVAKDNVDRTFKLFS